ncbi:MAG: hypothetical protein ABII25_02345 [bacterium]
MKIKKYFYMVFFSTFFLINLINPAAAHKVNIYAYAEENTVFVEGYFPDGRPTKNSRITVYNQKGDIIIEGATDETGKFSFKPSIKTDFKIVMNASMGHRAEFLLPESEQSSLSTRPDNKADEDNTSGLISELKAKKDKTGQSHKRGMHKEAVPWAGIFAGLGFIFGLSGFVISLLVNGKLNDRRL